MRARIALVALALLTAACGGSSPAAPAPPTASNAAAVARPDLPEPPPPSHSVVVERDVPYSDGLTLDVYRPDTGSAWPLVVLMPGGAWDSADPASTAPLAEDLAARGAVVLNGTYRLRAPEAFADAACAVRLAASRGASWGADPGRLVLAGYSAGAHVTAVAAFGGDSLEARCAGDGPPAAPSAWVGIAGPYDMEKFSLVPELRAFFGGGPAASPDAWAAGDPATHAGGSPGTAAFLVHGRTDLAVLPVFSAQFAETLAAAGREVGLYLIPSANHGDVIDPQENGAQTAAVILAAAG